MPKFFIKLVLVLCGFFVSSPKAAEQVTIQMLLEKGIVVIETYPEKAPKTVKRITELINQGFYDGLTFHRVISGFMAQGGDPAGNGTGGSGKNIGRMSRIETLLKILPRGLQITKKTEIFIMLVQHSHQMEVK